MVIVFLPYKTTMHQEFDVIVSGFRNITMCPPQCETLMDIVTCKRAGDNLHTFLASALDADGCSPSHTGSLTSRKAPPLSGSRKKPIGGLAVTVRGVNFIFP